MGQVEKKTDRIDEKVEDIMENHLPHIRNDLQHLKTLAALNIGAIIAGVLIAKYL